MYQAGELHAFAIRSRGSFRIIKSRQDLDAYLIDRRSNRKITAGFLSLEGAHSFDSSLQDLQDLFDAGFRVIGLTHFHDNKVGGSAHGVMRDTLTDLGRDVIKKMGELKLIADLAHASRPLIDDVLALFDSLPPGQRPALLVSHTGVEYTCPVGDPDRNPQRNLSDEHIRGIADRGGLIGIAFFKGVICGDAVADIVKAIRYVGDMVGYDHVALGSDWDGFQDVPMDAANLAKLTHSLGDSRFVGDTAVAAVARIMGLNAKEFLEGALPEH